MTKEEKKAVLDALLDESRWIVRLPPRRDGIVLTHEKLFRVSAFITFTGQVRIRPSQLLAALLVAFKDDYATLDTDLGNLLVALTCSTALESAAESLTAPSRGD